MGAPRVVPVEAAGVERFLDVAGAVEAAEPGFIPPIRAAVRAEVLGRAAPGGELQAFVCERDGRAVGRVAALIVPRLVDASGAPLGQLGFYACADDAEASRVTLEVGLAWLRARGARAAVAPMNGGVHRAHRVMTRGCERAPFLLEPRNPPWYPAQLVAAGFAPVHRWTTYELARAKLAPLRAVLRRLARRAPGLEVEFVEAVPAALPRFHALLDRVWAGHPGWAPISLDELGETFGALLPLLRPRHLAVLVDDGGRDVGIGFMFPDWADEVRALGGDASGWGRWMDRGRARRVVAHTVAVVPEVRGSAAGAKVIAAALDVAIDAGYESLVFPLTVETFRFWDHRRLAPTREYALYGRQL